MNFLFYHFLTKDRLEKEASYFNATKSLLGKAFSSGKTFARNEWDSMGNLGKAMTVLPAAMQVPGLANKYDNQGRSRMERMTTLGGNIIGGLAGGGIGTSLGNKLTKATSNMGSIGKGLGSTGKLVSQVVGGLGGSIVGERAAGAPFKLFKSQQPQPQYALNPTQNPPQETPASNQSYFQPPK